jgi:hypothetical protein
VEFYTKMEAFSDKSMYSALITNGNNWQHRRIWKLKAPLKIKVFMVFMPRGNTNKIQPCSKKLEWKQKCVVCSFFECHFARFL